MAKQWSTKLSPDRYLANKEYFDKGLIDSLENLQKQSKKMKKEAEIRRAAIFDKDATIKTLKMKLRDVMVINHNLNRMLCDKNKDAEVLKNELEKEIAKIQKMIDEELHRSYVDNDKLHNENIRLKKENERLKREQERSKKRLNMNSTNSSKPSSTDSFRHTTNMRSRSERKKGGQQGHQGHFSKLKNNPDNIVEKYVKKVPTGAIPVYNESNEITYYITQEIDAEFKTTVTETRYFLDTSGEELTQEIMMRYAINSTIYAPHFKAMVLYLNSKGTIALDRLCQILKEMSDEQISLKPSSVVNWSKEFYDKSSKTNDNILIEIKRGSNAGVDETGWRANGATAWMHTITSSHYAYFVATRKRCDDEYGPLKLLEDYEGTLMHDHFKPYYRLMCRHAECNAHVLRYLKGGFEQYEDTGCMRMIQLLQSMNNRRKEAINQGETSFSDSQIEEYKHIYNDIIEETLDQYFTKNPTIMRKYIPDYIKVLERMRKNSDQHLLFIIDFTVPFDNNASERQMRPTKAKKKISGQNLSIETANHFAAIHTIIQTCSLQKLNTLQTIEGILCGKDAFGFLFIAEQ